MKTQDLPLFIPVKVSYDDLAIGMKQSQSYCPGALAIRRKLALEDIEFSNILVDEERIAIYQNKNGTEVLLFSQNTPENLKNLLIEFDLDISTSPIEFNLYLKEGFEETRYIGRSSTYFLEKMRLEQQNYGGF
jgi:hypothetical protein